jgi:hypothetical protein
LVGKLEMTILFDVGDIIKNKNTNALARVRKVYENGGSVMVDTDNNKTDFIAGYILRREWELFDKSYVNPALVEDSEIDDSVLDWLDSYA